MSYLPRYAEFGQETRNYIIRCLGNSKMRMPRRTAEQIHDYLRVLGRSLRVMRSDYYRSLSPDIPWDNYVCSMYMDEATLLEYLRCNEHPETYIIQRVLRAAEYCYQHQYLYHPFNARLQNWRLGYFYHAARYHAGVEPLRPLIEYLLSVVEHSAPDDYSAAGINIHLYLPGYLLSYRPQLRPEEERALCTRMDGLMQGAMDYLGRIRAYHEPHVINESLQFLVSSAAEAQASSLKQVFDFFLAGHSPTYIHSQMVAMLTRRLVQRQLDTAPEAMLGVCGYNTVSEVKDHAAEICKLAYCCGLYHDIGKSMVLTYISDSSRRPLAEEFACIQQHPNHGYSLLCKLGRESDLAQAALYHHCYYNGRGGYPPGLAPCPPDIKPIVDALSVADSLDAATDGIGRCYTIAKPYETLVGELRAEQGTRYSPAVVALFDDNTFYNHTKEVLYEERSRIYVSVYRAVKGK